MALKEFKNLPNTDTPINAENLNHNFNELNKDNIYSTEETFTGKYWIDGKKIYRKVINFGALPNATVKNILHNISDINFIIGAIGMAYRSMDGTYFPIPYPATTQTNTMQLTCSSTQVMITTSIDRSNVDICYIILEYTKTTN